jgi:catechol 2,3-dioxygenase-like lactoylglutathione lyase family enzyme
VFKVKYVSHITYPTSDFEKSKDFLLNTMGFVLQQRGTTTYIGVGDTLLELSRRPPAPVDPERPTAYLLGFEVDDLDDIKRRLKDAGFSAEIDSKSDKDSDHRIQDPDGHWVDMAVHRRWPK